jgi:hypothetical protein
VEELMKRAGLVLAVFVGATCATASAQDSRSVVQAAAVHMGATNLKTIQITGSGFTAAFGQSYRLTDDFPRFEVPAYTRVIDYERRIPGQERCDCWSTSGASPAVRSESMSGGAMASTDSHAK